MKRLGTMGEEEDDDFIDLNHGSIFIDTNEQMFGEED